MDKKSRRRWVQEGEEEVSMGRRRGQELGGGGSSSLHFDPPGWSSGDREEGSKR